MCVIKLLQHSLTNQSHEVISLTNQVQNVSQLFPALVTRYHVFPRFPAVARFPALGSGVLIGYYAICRHSDLCSVITLVVALRCCDHYYKTVLVIKLK